MTNFEKSVVSFVAAVMLMPIALILVLYFALLMLFEPVLWFIIAFLFGYYFFTRDEKKKKNTKQTEEKDETEAVRPEQPKRNDATYIVYAHGNMTPKAVANFNGKAELKQAILPDGHAVNVLNQDLADFLASNPGDGLIINTVAIEVPEN